MKILCACGNGMGTSLIIKLKVESILKEGGVEDFKVDSCSLGQAASVGGDYDIVLCTTHLADELQFPHTKVIGLQNVMDETEIRNKFITEGGIDLK